MFVVTRAEAAAALRGATAGIIPIRAVIPVLTAVRTVAAAIESDEPQSRHEATAAMREMADAIEGRHPDLGARFRELAVGVEGPWLGRVRRAR